MEISLAEIHELRPLGKVFTGTWAGRPALVKKVPNLVEYHIEVAMLKVTTGHPNLLGLLGVCATERIIISPYFAGGDLWARTRAKVFTEPAAAQILKDLCAGLIFLHQRRIMHRDVKAMNGVLNELGGAVLIDMGACCAEGSPLAKKRRGTIGWAAPELMASPTYGVKVDVFSIGVLSLFLLTGQLVFGRGAVHDGSAAAYQQRAIAGLGGARDLDLAKVSPRYLSAVKGCLEGDPEHRFGAHEAMTAFAATLDGKSPGDASASHTCPGTPTRKDELLHGVDALDRNQSDSCSTATGSRQNSLSSTSSPEKYEQTSLSIPNSSSPKKAEVPKERATASTAAPEQGQNEFEPKEEEGNVPVAAWTLSSEVCLGLGLLATCGVVMSIGVGIGAAVAASGISMKAASVGFSAAFCPLQFSHELRPLRLSGVKVSHEQSREHVLTAAERAFL